MSTFLFDKIIFGPVRSRRLGISLGVNLLPVDSKVCSFDCIYCECGWTPRKREKKAVLPTRQEVKEKMQEKLQEMKIAGETPDVITFAGNGEPTLHPEFAGIIDDTIELRNQLAPNARIAVLSNATMIHKSAVVNALLKVDDNIQKLDSAFAETVEKLDCPMGPFDLEKTVENLKAFNKQVIIQTLFIRGKFKNEWIDNTTEEEILAWLKLIQEIKPRQVMIYTIDRDTPTQGLERIPVAELEGIAGKIRNLGFEVQVSG
ncbi:MAG: radical SAM protein [Bacteroidetes bacterium GWF2_42_66]|nr:MAG: radical SAM protein [Bacteroidetes bacterium GWA2_42_15]OFX98417.1 MAG: radical SAM protein [Bacteroidetes bacterium GWE2_42_39]OFY42802.1 MAG: radical SAM protein [Bacteroidetes bacterium GWF2_42_66]HBL74424.1 radical SAM protein [Prolixibacteraceae bacterium]HCR90953.1 radical SAM protein [Prolixibacteraceae bacterium]